MTSCFGGKCNNVTNPVAVANPMQTAVQRRPTGIRRTGANNATTTYNPLRRPANMTNRVKKMNAAMARAFPTMPDNQNINAEWAKPSAGQTQAERNAELAEKNRKKREATEWPNSPVDTPRMTKRKPVKQVAVINIGNQPHINEARRDLPAGWYADYDNNGRIGYYYQATPRSAPTPFTYTKPT